MLEVTIPEQHYEFLNENTNEFIYIDVKETTLSLEHSLISIRKWEEKWKKAFLEQEELSVEESRDYVRCMTLNSKVDNKIYNYIPDTVMVKIVEYMRDPMSATVISVVKPETKKEVVTAEVVYAWLVNLGIPFEVEKWHINKLLKLIQVLNIKNGTNKPLDAKTAAAQRRAINKVNRAKYHSKG